MSFHNLLMPKNFFKNHPVFTISVQREKCVVSLSSRLDHILFESLLFVFMYRSIFTSTRSSCL